MIRDLHLFLGDNEKYIKAHLLGNLCCHKACYNLLIVAKRKINSPPFELDKHFPMQLLSRKPNKKHTFFDF